MIPRLHLPVPAPPIVTARFGDVGPAWTRYGHHTGLDLAVPSGTLVTPVYPGVVEWARDFGAYGLSVMLYHGWGRSLYAHLSTLPAAWGEFHDVGSAFAESGTTGLATGPHLHLGLFPVDEPDDNGSGGAVDPEPWFYV